MFRGGMIHLAARTIGALVIAGSVMGASGVVAQELRITQQVSGLETPWALAILPNGDVLVTERDGRLLRVREGTSREVAGAPQVVDAGQGGLLDITLARDFDRSRTIFLTYAKALEGGAGTALAAAELSQDGARLENLRDLFTMSRGSAAGQHFGSRVVEARDGTLFVTVGERGDRPAAQDLGQHNGSVVRVNRDGTVPYGHRNPQGAALDLEGNLWVSEHGARGGDEVNAVYKGANYGWPVISYGRHYSGAKIGEGTTKEGMEQPAFYWDPSIAPSGLLVYSGKMFPDWRGDIFVGSLKFNYIARLQGDPLAEVTQISTPATARVRDIIEAPDGAIWFISVGNGAVYRISND